MEVTAHDGENRAKSNFVIAGLDPATHGMSQCLRELYDIIGRSS
jgi:hypothetical protein